MRKYERELREFGPPDDGPDKLPVPETLTDDQLAEIRKGIDEGLGPGMADWFLHSFEGPLPEAVVDSIPETFPERAEVVAEHDRMRRLLGDLRRHPSDPDDETVSKS